MAEDVGDIYVEGHVDTKSMSREMRRAANQAGKDFGTYFTKSAGSELDTTFSRLGANLRHSMASNGKLTAIDFSKSMKDVLQREFTNWEIDLSHAVVLGDWGRVLDRFDDVEDGATRARKRLRELADSGALTANQFDKAVDSMSKWVATTKVAAAESADLARAQKKFKLQVDQQAKSTKEAVKQTSSLVTMQRKLREELEKSLLTGDTRGAGETAAQLQRVEAAMKRLRDATKAVTKEERTSFSVLGRLRGSRNDFLHLIGGVSQALEGLPNRLVDTGRGFKKMIDGISDAARGARGFGKVLAVLRGGMSSLGTSLAGITAGGAVTGLATVVALLYQIGLVGELITATAGGLSAMAGIITALAASIGSALGGALLSVGPMLGAFVAGMGALTLAIVNNQKAFKRAVRPVSDWAEAVGKVAGQAMLPSITRAADDLADVLGDKVTPLLESSAEAVGDWAEEFAGAMDSPRMRRNLTTFERTWPDIMRNLGSIFTDVFTGISGIVAAISPSVEKFTDEIAKGAEKFSDWANSAGGKNKVKEWFDGAWESAKLLWGIVENLAGAFGNIFGEGKDNGDSLLSSLEKITEEFEKWTGTEKGREQISQWFEDAEDLAGTLWELLEDIGETFDDWDTSETRQDFEDIVGFVGSIVQGLRKAVLFADGLWETLTFQQGNPIQDMWDTRPFFDSIGESLSNFNFNDFVANLPNPFADWFFGTVTPWFQNTFWPWLSGLGGDIVSGFQEGVSGAWDGLVGWWNGLWQGILDSVLSMFGVRSPSTVFAGIGSDIIAGLIQGLAGAWQGVVTWWNQTAVPWFQGLPTRIGRFFQNMWGKFSTGIGQGWAKVTGWWGQTAVPWFQGLPKRVSGWFSNMWSQFADGIGRGWSKVTSWWSGTAVPWFQGLPERVSGFFSRMWGQFTSGIREGWSKVTGWWSGTAVPWFRGLPDRVSGFFQDMWNEMVEGAKSIPGKIRSWWTGTAWPEIKGIFTGSSWGSIGADIVGGLVSGLEDNWYRATTWANNAFNALSAGARKVLGIDSPSKVFMDIGRYTVEGFMIGFRKQAQQGRGAFADLTASTLKSMTDGLTKGAKEAGGEVERVMAKITDIQVAAIKSNQRALENTIKSVRNQEKISSTAKSSTITDLREYYAAVNASVREAGANLRGRVKELGNSLTTTLKRFENQTRALDAAKKKLDELRTASAQMRESVTASITGQLDLGTLVSDGGARPTFEGIASYVASMKAKAVKFRNRMRKLVESGLPPAFVQELAGLGLDGAIQVADALLTGSRAQIKQLSADYGGFTSAAGSIGKLVADDMYLAGINSQKALIRGLTEDTGDLKRAAQKLASRLTKYVKDALQIKSPSRVFQDLGVQTMRGMAMGIERGGALAVRSVRSVLGDVTGAGVAIGSGVVAGGRGAAPAGFTPVNTGRQVLFAQGAIQVNTQVQDPRLVASQVLDRLVVQVG